MIPTWPSGLAASGDTAVDSARAAARGQAPSALTVLWDGKDPAVLAPTAPVWKAVSAKVAQIVVEVPASAAAGEVAAAARGETTARWAAAARALTQVSDKPVALTIGAPPDANPDQVRAAGKAISAALSSVSGRVLLFWSVPLGTDPAAAVIPEQAAAVSLTMPPDKSWAEISEGPSGINAWTDWAASQKRRVALTWTIGPKTSPATVTALRSWLAVQATRDRLALESVTITRDANPAAVTAYNKAW